MAVCGVYLRSVLNSNRANVCRYSILNNIRSKSSSSLLEFSPHCDEQCRETLSIDMQIHQDFISLDEEGDLLKELEEKFKRARYQYDHWDDVSFYSFHISWWPFFLLCHTLWLYTLVMKAIHGYRETEKPIWNEVNTKVIDRLRSFAFTDASTVMQHVHVLDLAENGHIKPHLDSVKV